VTDEPDFVLIGRVRSAHGLGGEVSVEPVSDIVERFTGLRRVLLKRGNEIGEVSVASVRRKGGDVLLKLDGTDERGAAEALAGAELGVRRQDVWPLDDGTYYVFDLIGSRVVGDGDREIGQVEDVLRFPANDVFVVRTGKGEALIPVTKNVIKRIDAANKVVVIEELNGLLD
jgi:16S rRNA processing protein RimM